MDTRDLAERAPGACTDLEPCWQFQGDFTRGFFESNDYLMWLLVLSLVLIVLACCIVWLFIVVLWQRQGGGALADGEPACLSTDHSVGCL